MSARSLFPILALFILLASLPAVAGASPEGTGSVKLPLADYLELVERAEELEREARREVEPRVADLAAQTTSIVVDGAVAAIATTFRVELAGEPTVPVTLPFSGTPEEMAVEPRHGASLHREDGRVVLYAPRPGSYAVTVRGRRKLDADSGTYRLPLAASPAPVASVEVELPAEHEWSCAGAVLVGEETRGERRHVRLAPARGTQHVLEMRRRLSGREEDRALTRSTAVTVVEVRRDSLQRQDVVLYEVLRGELGAFELTLPPGLEVDRVATDEGDALPLVEERRLRVERGRRLAGTGHLVVTFRPQRLDAAALPLPPLEPRIAPRARYLVTASAVAAEVRPQPEDAWRRVDLEDLPGRLRQEIEALDPNAVWRLAAEDVETSLAASPLPGAERLGGVVWERHTTTLLTVDGSLVHRDRFVVEHTGTAFEVGLPSAAVLWSVRLDGLAVRPLERGAAIVVPLAFKSEGRTEVELVAVEERAIEPGRSRVRLEAPRVAEPVVRHEWRLLLPEGNRYRFAQGELMPAVEEISRPEPIPTARDPLSGIALPYTGILGTVVDTQGSPLPGVTVTLRGVDRLTITDRQGRFWFRNLSAGTYKILAQLDGFGTFEHPSVKVRKGRTTQLEVTLSPAIEETITIVSEAPLLDERKAEARWREIESQQRQDAVEETLDDFQSGLVGGVKPLQVAIPESGKLLALSGALPPPRVAVELDVKARP